MKIHEPWQEPTPRKVDYCGVVWILEIAHHAHPKNPVAMYDDHRILSGWSAGSVDQCNAAQNEQVVSFDQLRAIRAASCECSKGEERDT